MKSTVDEHIKDEVRLMKVNSDEGETTDILMQEKVSDHQGKQMTWTSVASTLDWFFYLTFALCCFIITTLLLIIMVYKGLLHPMMDGNQLHK